MLFRLENVGKEFSGRWLFTEITAQCNDSDRIGLIGANGAGKTTLFELIEGGRTPDEGHIFRSRRLQSSRVEQIPRFEPARTLREETLEVFADLHRVERELRELEHAIAEQGLEGSLGSRYEELHTIFEMRGGYDYGARTEAVLFGLGFQPEDLEAPCEHLSGGQRSRMALAKALLKPSNLLLLDEPTNHVDLQGILWLEQYLKELQGALIVISHDRHFLDRVTERTWEIEGGSLFDYPASFSKSRRLRDERVRLASQAFERQLEWKRRTEDFVRRNIAGQKTKQAQARRRQLAKEEWLEEPVDAKPAVHIRIPETGRGGSVVFEVHDGTVGYENKILIDQVELTVERGRRIGILGGNGSGKSTLLKTILGELNLLAGKVRWGHNYVAGYFAQEGRFAATGQTAYEVLAGLNPSWTDEELRGFAARFGFRGEEIFKSVDDLSGGERSRLSLARLFSHPCNALFLDEPTNHLDIDSREALEEALSDFGGALVVVSHDLFFLQKTVSEFFLIREGRLERLERLEDLEQRLAAAQTGPTPKPFRAERKEESRPGLSKNERERIRRRLAQVEARIGALEKDRSQIEEELQSGSQDHTHLHRISCQFQAIEDELARLYGEWEETAGRLE
jgi:ATP-binding cassette subfamily F protein 3